MFNGVKNRLKNPICPLKPVVGIADAIEDCMTSITKTAVPEVTDGFTSFFALIAAKVRAAIDGMAPVGYQDETGFHTGVKPRDEQAAGIATW